MDLNCCCNEGTDGSLAVVVNDSAKFEGDVLNVQGPSGSTREEQLPIPSSARSDMDTARTNSSNTKLTAEEKEKEKARLQQLVNSFVRTAAKGCECIYLKEVSGERCITRYFLDKRLEHMVVVASSDNSVAEVRCPIGAIQDIYSFGEDGAGCFPQKIVGLLTPEEQERLLMVVYRSDRGGTHRFCILEATLASRDTLLECLRILCIYMQSLANTNQASNAQAAIMTQ